MNACVNLQAGRVSAEITLDADVNRTGDVWHVMVPGLVPGLLYGEGWEGVGVMVPGLVLGLLYGEGREGGGA